MALLANQVQLYLQLEGHLPEKFLLMEIFGRTEKEADQIIRWRRAESLRYNPAVHALRVTAERKRLRKELGLPEVANEEVSYNGEGDINITTAASGMAVIGPNGVEFSGMDNLPPHIAEVAKQQMREKLEGMPPGSGFMEMPGGGRRHFMSLGDFLQKFEQQGEEGTDGSEDSELGTNA